MDDNMRYYEAGRSVPKNAQREFDNGTFSGTDINPMWRIKKLTEMFGPAGIGWYVEVFSERAETYGDTVMAIIDLNLFVKDNGEWSKPIFGTGGNLLVRQTRNGAKASDEGYKMAFTDALSIACKSLGIGADIWYANDVTKYTANQTPAPKPAPAPETQIPMQSVAVDFNEKPTPDQLADLWELIPDDGSREKVQAKFGKGFDKMTLRDYNACVARCHELREAKA